MPKSRSIRPNALQLTDHSLAKPTDLIQREKRNTVGHFLSDTREFHERLLQYNTIQCNAMCHKHIGGDGFGGSSLPRDNCQSWSATLQLDQPHLPGTARVRHPVERAAT